MVLNPHVQKKAQEELDAVLGPATLPTMSDRDRLPYVKRLILELLRWRPVLPIGALILDSSQIRIQVDCEYNTSGPS